MNQQNVLGEFSTPSIMLRIDESRMKEHYGRLRRLGIVLTFVCLAIGVAAPFLRVYLLYASAVLAIGMSVGIVFWVQARRALRRPGALNARLDGSRITVWHDGTAPLVMAEPVGSGVAYPDFVMLGVGTNPMKPHQVELVLDADDREAVLRTLTENQVFLRTTKYTRGQGIILALTIMPLVVFAGYLAYRALILVMFGGIMFLLHQLPTTVGLAGFFLLAAAGLVLIVVRTVRLSR